MCFRMHLWYFLCNRKFCWNLLLHKNITGNYSVMFLRYERPFGQDCNISYISTKEGGTFMKKNVKKLSAVLSVIMLMILASPLTVLAAEEEAAASAKFYGTFWALVPPIVAIALALITKNVFISLLIGILTGNLVLNHCLSEF
mgnify:FL=1